MTEPNNVVWVCAGNPGLTRPEPRAYRGRRMARDAPTWGSAG
jgi:hypothetical protein